MNKIKTNCLPALIGSLPMKDHRKATELMLSCTPEIPLWVQLPIYSEEGMMTQFLPGFPGITIKDEKIFIDTESSNFEQEFLSFFEDYLLLSETGTDISNSRFAMTTETAKGFFELINILTCKLLEKKEMPFAIKGQVTGPITFCTSVTDQNGRAIFYNDQLKDAAIKHLAMKAKWQVQQFAKFNCPTFIFLDEPVLAGFGTSAFITITRKDAEDALNEIIDTIHAEGGLAGIHVCANTEWPILLESSVDIISFDAYSFFDKFILYPEQIKQFMEKGGLLAWGIVPTDNLKTIEKESVKSLLTKWNLQALQLEKIGLTMETIMSQTMITPSCGTGSLPLNLATKVLELTRGVADELREQLV
ncbi:MAG: hypothetical protein B6I31_01105 [Desulfobacteraceae bacterium 4572_19]|nr:MAG: hypothetical protein B6I31_01105 [Desulfobacteraceae bacterium 4572_19]